VNLISYELRKTFFNKTTVIFLVCLVIINMLTLYIQERINFEFDADISSIRKIDYKLMSMDELQAVTYLNEHIIIHTIAYMNQQSSINSLEKQYPDYNIIELLSRYNQGNYDSYTGIIHKDLSIFRHKLMEVESVYSYDEYMKSINNRASQLNQSPLFSDTPFTIRNATKTADDYNNLNVSDIRFNSSNGVICATGNSITPMLLCVSSIFICIQIFVRDRDNNNIELLKTMKRGRKFLMSSKMISMVCLVSVCVIVTVLSSYIISLFIYGFGDISMPIQSVYGFKSSIFGISVSLYLILHMLLTVLAMIFIASVIMLIFVSVHDSLIGISVFLGFMGISFILNRVISSISFFNVFKYINAYYFLNTSKIVSDYLNINLLNYPVSLYPLFYITVLFGTASVFYICINIFEKQKAKIYSKSGVFRFKKVKIIPKAGIFKYEVYKSLIINPALIILLIFFIFQIVTVRPLEPIEMLTKKEFIHMKYIDVLEGPISSSKSEFLEENLLDVRKMQREDIYDSYADQIEVIMSIIAHDKRLHNIYESTDDLNIKQNISFIYEKGYKEFFTDGSTTRLTALYVSILIVLCMSDIFANEIKNNTYDVITYTVYGRKRTFWYKQIITLIISLTVLGAVYIPYILKFIKESGFNCLNASMACITDFAYIPLNISILEYFICLFLSKFIGVLMIATFINLISHMTGETVVTAFISLFIFVVPAFLSFSGVNTLSDLFMNVFLYGNKLISYNDALLMQGLIIIIVCILVFIVLYFKFNKEKLRFCFNKKTY